MTTNLAFKSGNSEATDGKMIFSVFLKIKADFRKTNHITIINLVSPTYTLNMSENNFFTVAAKFRFCSIFSGLCS